MDLILHNANVITLDAEKPKAQVVAVKGDRITWVGSEDDLGALKDSNTRVIDCQDKTVLPGFIDAHTHLFAYASSLLSVDCSPSAVSSIEDIQLALKRRAQGTPPGAWVKGVGYNEFYLRERRHPTRRELDEAASRHPVKLSHRSRHACVLNSMALALSHISIETADPPGGVIDRDVNTGEPTGLLLEMNDMVGEQRDNAMDDENFRRGIAQANKNYLSMGITSFHEASVTNGVRQWQILRELKERGELIPRVYMMAGTSALSELGEQGLSAGHGDENLRIGPLKIMIRQTSGAIYPPLEELKELVLRGQEAGFQVALHAVEEEEVEAAISALENASQKSTHPHRRHRIEHCSLCPPPLLERLRGLEALVVTQPSFLYYSGERYMAQVPREKHPWLYPLKSLLSGGVGLAASSDCPVVPPSPLMGIYAAITRRSEAGDALQPAEAVQPIDVLRMYTGAGAYASFEEDLKGSISVGKLADLVVLDNDPLAVFPEEIKSIKIEMTIAGGGIVWDRTS